LANKEKLLASAQKNLKKKALPKAIKDFVKVIELDPNDMRSRQKLAELYSRTGNSSGAFEQYETVAKYFSSNGFYLKAIAIYRQMQKLDPTQISIHARLGELNEKQGLIGNALSEYRLLVDYYEKNAMTEDVVRTLERMQEIDPDNLNIRIKRTEVLAGNGQLAEGRECLDGVLQELKGQQDYDRTLKVYKKFLPLFPNDSNLRKGLAVALLEGGEQAKGLELLQSLLRDNPDDAEVLGLLADTYRERADLNNCRLTYQHLLKLDSSNLEHRASLIDCCLEAGMYEQALADLEEWKEGFQSAGQLAFLKASYEKLKQNLPENGTVAQTLNSIYELTGDTEMLFDALGSDAEGADPATDEDVSDSLLDTASDDIDDDQVLDIADIESPFDDFVALDTLADEAVEDDEEVIELEISDQLQVEAIEEDSLDLDFDLGEEEDLPAADDLQSELEEAEFYLQQGLFDEAERVCRELLEANPGDDACQRKMEDVLQRRASMAADNDASTELHDLANEVLEDGFSDLALESLDSLLGDDDDSEFDDLLAIGKESPIFRTDVDDQIAADDMESHYNLGIAYREMGLFDDAIGEFDKAQADPSRFVDCQTLKALCYADKGNFDKSEAAYRTALSSASLDDGQRLSLHYDLGVLYENFQHPEQALASYRLVFEVDPHFRDIAEKMASLNGAQGSAARPGGKDRISFL
jgi:tetratricopeptide (TPR) repeat protein